MSSERKSGGIDRSRTTRDGQRVDTYRAVCGSCKMHGPDGTTQRVARRLAVAAKWTAELRRTFTGFGETRVLFVRCPACRDAENANRLP